MNEIQIIRQQLAIERAHFAEVAAACSDAIESGRFAAEGALASACADYLRFAAGRLPSGLLPQTPPETSSPSHQWLEFLQAFERSAASHFDTIDRLDTRNPSVLEWRTIARIDADAIVNERNGYLRVRAALP